MSIDSLLPIVSTDWAAANDAVNNANSLLNPFFKHKAIIESMASPAPILSIAVSDIAAYESGRRIGKRKLIESISPNKTYEGLVGGTVISFLDMSPLKLLSHRISNLIVFGAPETLVIKI